MSKANRNRILSAILAVATLLSMVSVSGLSVEAEAPQQTQPPVSNIQQVLPEDHDTLKITVDGKEAVSLELLSYQKIDITATGLDEKASYQWQILHPEKENQWVNIFDATEAEIPVTAALIKNMLTAEGTAKLRCRAVTDSYAYLTPAFTVTLVEETAEENLEQSVTLFSAPVPLADDPVPEFVTVTIEYVQFDFLRDAYGNLVYDGGNLVYDDGKQAFTSYMATIHGGTDLKTTVHFPTMIGYDSYFQDQATPSTSYAINLTNVTSDVVFTVKYMPAEVEYSVRYFFQNVYDDMYVEDASMKVTTEGRTGAEPPDSLMKPEVDGFTALYHQPDAIAADGSTVFEVFYERNYYLMEFDCNGGYGTETLYLRYGSYISVPVPVRHGYVFGNNGDGNGWDLHTTEEPGNTETLDDGHGNPLPPAMPHYNSAYTAIWDVSETSYTVVYWRENANDNGYSYWDSLQIGLRADGVTYDGTVHSNDHVSGTDAALRANSVISQLSNYQYFAYNAVKTELEESKRTDLASDGKIVVEGDGSTVVNVYFYRKYYTINFTGYGTCSLPAHKHGTDCQYQLLCGVGDHIHSGECVSTLTCEIPPHNAHTAECINCGKQEHTHGITCSKCDQEEHTHGAACCKYDEHLHSIVCYGPNSNQYSIADNDDRGYEDYISTIANPKEGYVYRYRRNSTDIYYYFYDGESWYYFGNQSLGLAFTNAQEVNNRVTVSSTQSSMKCGLDEHTHGNGNCDYSGCLLHTHTETCYVCGEVIHTHGADCCTKDVHSASEHTTACYAGVGDQVNSAGSSAPNNPAEGYVYLRTYNSTYYIRIKGNWYYYTGSTTNGNIAPTICHSHDDGTCSCAAEIHKHTDACMDCGLTDHKHEQSCYKDVIHSHNDSCYTWTCGASAHTHTDDCYSDTCLLQAHSHTSNNPNCEANHSSNIIYSITAKYEQDISDIWPTYEKLAEAGSHAYQNANGVVGSNNGTNKFRGWSIEGVSNEAVSKRLTMTDDLCDTADGIKSGSATYGSSYYVHLYYMFESFDQTSPENGNTRKKFGSKYYEVDTEFSQDVYANSNSFGQKEITGMKAVGTDNDNQIASSEYNNFLFYDRVPVKLMFHSVNATAQTVTGLLFESPLKNVKVGEILAEDYEPPYPSTYEPGAYEFGGWYTTPDCYLGTEVDWEEGEMPHVDLEVYAKWTPVLRNVTFYSAYSDVPSATNPSGNTPFMTATGVPHGTTVGSAYFYTPEWPDDLDTATNGGALSQEYDFVGWFYMDEDNKKKFAPDSMEITRDLILFAEWQTGIDTTYEVQYVLKEDVSKENTQDGVAYPAGTQIADTVSAHSSVGKTKTFAAKGLGELKEAFRKKFFPTVNTHSILMEPNGDLNKYTFEYVYDDTVYFKVRYLDYSTKEELKPSKVDQTDEAIITEKFLPIQGYVPQSFYIRKTLAYDGSATEDSVIEENVITFYYVKDTQHGLYSIEYYLENEDSTDENNPANYYQYESIVGSDDLNHNITAPIRTYSGFTYKPDMNTVITYKENGEPNTPVIGLGAGDPPTGKVNYTGLTIKIYYQRNEYPYIIEYRENGAPADAPALGVIADGIGAAVPNDQKNYDAELKHTALATFEKDGILYEYYISNSTEEQRTKTIAIRESVTGEENKLIFFYKKHEVNVLYIPVCKIPGADDYGVVSLYSEYSATASALSGSNATAGSGFVFVGWFKDEKCTVPVDTSWRYDPGVGDGDDTPNPSGTKLRPQTLDAKADEVRYYALFEPVTSNLTITKTVTGTSRKDTFLFNIKGLGKNSYIDMVVSISGSGSAVIDHIPIGDYTITELTGWSWQYGGSPEQSTITITTEAQSIAFTNNYNGSDWLTGEHGITNQFSNTP